MLRSEATASFACLRCHQLHLNPKRRIPKESTEGWKAIDIRDFNCKRFVQKLFYICLPPSCAYLQYKYEWVHTSARGHEISGCVHAHAYNYYAWAECAWVAK